MLLAFVLSKVITLFDMQVYKTQQNIDAYVSFTWNFTFLLTPRFILELTKNTKNSNVVQFLKADNF